MTKIVHTVSTNITSVAVSLSVVKFCEITITKYVMYFV